MTPYIFSLILNENSLTVNQTVSSDFKIHVQADKINDVFSIINDISVLHRPFFVNYQSIQQFICYQKDLQFMTLHQ